MSGPAFLSFQSLEDVFRFELEDGGKNKLLDLLKFSCISRVVAAFVPVQVIVDDLRHALVALLHLLEVTDYVFIVSRTKLIPHQKIL